MLARGASYAGIVRALSLENAALDENDRAHERLTPCATNACRHFPAQNVARATSPRDP